MRRERQVHHRVHLVVVLAHLIARGTKEGYHNATIRLLATKPLYQRTCLLKLTYGRSMYPHRRGEAKTTLDLLLRLLLTFDQQLGLTMAEQCCDPYDPIIEKHD